MGVVKRKQAKQAAVPLRGTAAKAKTSTRIGATARLLERPVTVIGHPFASIGMGEQMRSHVAAMAAVGLEPGVLDIFGYAPRDDSDYVALVDSKEVRSLGDGFRIFHINGDEIERVLERLGDLGEDFSAGFNIIVPAWELPRYPRIWSRALSRFDEVWSLSAFIQRSLQASRVDSIRIGQSLELPKDLRLPRRYFGIRESSFVMLAFLDLTSFASRKNPEAVLAVYERLRARDRFGDFQLVLKVKNGQEAAEGWVEEFRIRYPDVLFISQCLSALETRSLIAACDCFLSLHRSEGFGRGAGEAMALGRLAAGTGWSGNVDYMNANNSLLVDFDLVAVPDDAYPHAKGLSWAEPSVEHAAELLARAIADPSRARSIANQGQQDVLRQFSHRAVGLRILERLSALETTSIAHDEG